mmetsp:Transcript_36897/g.119091  ORF Transcript_36897/g.119091 Transcript_36897/m.119091 type:complete len:315 (-) Transcript_36897:302-1246(-)
MQSTLPATRIERPISESKGAQPVVFCVQNQIKRSYRTITVRAIEPASMRIAAATINRRNGPERSRMSMQAGSPTIEMALMIRIVWRRNVTSSATFTTTSDISATSMTEVTTDSLYSWTVMLTASSLASSQIWISVSFPLKSGTQISRVVSVRMAVRLEHASSIWLAYGSSTSTLKGQVPRISSAISSPPATTLQSCAMSLSLRRRTVSQTSATVKLPSSSVSSTGVTVSMALMTLVSGPEICEQPSSPASETTKPVPMMSTSATLIASEAIVSRWRRKTAMLYAQPRVHERTRPSQPRDSRSSCFSYSVGRSRR